ncbi:hypothetical protein [Streptomyces sp. NRRL S-350]|uniref:hypothetical protein n=1 Tax=Streptomyces sp. NRRL S-350 TaxID=1463902 RepID=UPI000A96AA19|nr:hypothetical protein [Streptomyces sp. NRRL S-350]
MKYHELTAAQKKKAQGILQRLHSEGVLESVSQVAVHFDNACAWDAGTITLATLLDRTGWTRTAPVETIHRAELPAGVLRHVRTVLAAEGSTASKEALELLPEV